MRQTGPRGWRASLGAVGFSSLAAVLLLAGPVHAAEEPIRAALEAARKAFSPLSAEDLRQAKSQLEEAVAALEERLGQAGPVGEDWRRYLRLEELEEELQRRPAPRLEKLDEIYVRFDAGHYGLGLIWFADVRRALRRYLITARGIGDPRLESQYQQVLDSLSKILEQYRASPAPESRRQLVAVLQWLEQARQAPRLIEAIRARYCQPNLYVEVSEPVVVAGIEREVDETAPVRDVILGADVYGTGRTLGRVTAELLPAEDHVELMLVMRGYNRSRTISYKGPACVYNRGRTELVGRKLLMADVEGMRAGPTRAEAATDTAITGVGTRRGSRLVQRIACRRAYKKKCEAEWVASRHAERDLRRRLDREATDAIRRANQRLRHGVGRPLRQRGLMPESIRMWSTSAAVHIRLLAARSFELAAPAPPPPTAEEAEVTVRLHESLVSNYAAAAIGGMRYKEEQLRAELEQLLGHVPEGLEPDRAAEPWSIRFAPGEPVTVWFDANRFRIRIRASGFTRGGRRYPGMHVTATYRIEPAEGGLVAVREGDLEILPPDFEQGVQRRLSSRENVLQTMLERRFAKVFPPRIMPEPITLPGGWKRAGPLQLVQWETQSGWMTLGWKRLRQESQSPDPPQGRASSERREARST